MGIVQSGSGEQNSRNLVERAQRALIALRLGQDGQAVDEAIEPATAGAGEHDLDEARKLILLLFAECSAMVANLGDGGSTPVKVQVFDSEGTEVSIDEADPPVRTAVRTLLAEVHGNTDAAAEQVEIALASAADEEIASLVLQALRWTMRLSTECLERSLPVTSWISEAMTS